MEFIKTDLELSDLNLDAAECSDNTATSWEKGLRKILGKRYYA